MNFKYSIDDTDFDANSNYTSSNRSLSLRLPSASKFNSVRLNGSARSLSVRLPPATKSFHISAGTNPYNAIQIEDDEEASLDGDGFENQAALPVIANEYGVQLELPKEVREKLEKMVCTSSIYCSFFKSGTLS